MLRCPARTNPADPLRLDWFGATTGGTLPACFCVWEGIPTGTEDRLPEAVWEIAGGEDRLPEAAWEIAGGEDRLPEAVWEIAGGEDRLPEAAWEIAGGEDRLPEAAWEIAGGEDRLPDAVRVGGSRRIAGGEGSTEVPDPRTFSDPASGVDCGREVALVAMEIEIGTGRGVREGTVLRVAGIDLGDDGLTDIDPGTLRFGKEI